MELTQIQKECNIFGVDNTLNVNPLIQKALNESVSLLNIFKFIEITEFELDPIMTNWFWQIMVNNHSSHLTRVILEWFGYEGEEREQKRQFIRMLKRNKIPYKELKHTDNEIELYPSIKEEMAILPHKGAVSSSKWLVMEPYDIKMAMLRLNTKNSDTIKRYYIRMEELVRMYAQYTSLFQKREKENMSKEMLNLRALMEDMKIVNKRQEEERKQDRQAMTRQENMLVESRNMLYTMGIEIKDIRHENNDLLDQNNELLERVDEVLHKVDVVQNKLNISVEDRAPQPNKNIRRERFLLLKRNNPNYLYYTIRAQEVNAKKALKRQKNMYDNVEILLDIVCHPNTKTFYVRIKDNLKKKGVVFNLCEIDISDSKIDEKTLIEEMMKINESKRNIEQSLEK